MRILTLFLFLMSTYCLASDQAGQVPVYKTQKRSIIDWKSIRPADWLNYHTWLFDLKEKEKWPYWERTVRERRLKEMVGRVIECKGKCKVLRGESNFNPTFKSAIMEGDEVFTGDNGYIWIYLFDGSIVRLSPHTSVSFREFNVGRDINFNYLRINRGQVFFQSRKENLYEESKSRETDTIFLPLTFVEANQSIVSYAKKNKVKEIRLKDQNALSHLQFRRLNKLITLNNDEFLFRKSFNLIVMPSGTLSGYDLQLEATVLHGGKSYFRQLSNAYLGIKENLEKESDDLTFYFRGYLNRDKTKITKDQWYEIDFDGEELNEIEENSLMAASSFIKKRIPSILVARELMFREYSGFVFNINLSKRDLSKNYGYRLWGLFNNKKSDSYRHFSFLLEYTRRIETTNLLNLKKLSKTLKERGEPLQQWQFDRRFFSHALTNFYGKREGYSLNLEDEKAINSTRRKFWKIIHGMH